MNEGSPMLRTPSRHPLEVHRAAAIGLLSAATMLFAAPAAHAQVAGPQFNGAIDDLPANLQDKFRASVKSFLASPPPPATRDAGDLGWDCMAAAALVEAGDKPAEKKLGEIAQVLADKAVRAKGQALGWPYEGKSMDSCPGGGLDAFGDGTCNKKDTVYSFQSGLGAACLAKAGGLLHSDQFTSTASQIFNYWQKFTLEKPACPGCIYYLYSDDANDRGRYVRNVNVFMAFGGAALGAAAHDDAATNLSRQAVKSELSERRAGNHGYLGRLDPEFMAKKADSAETIENHAAAVALVMDQIGVIDHSSEAREHGLGVWREWATCNNKRCQKTTCNVWGGNATTCQATLTATHCAFRNRDPLAARNCNEYLSRASSLPTYALWATVYGGANK